MINEIKKLLKKVWNFIKKVFVAVLEFSKHIIDFFRSKLQRILRKKPNAVAVAVKIKEDLASGNYNTVNMNDYVVNTFYDKETGEILEDESEIVSYARLDETTKNSFGNKDMIVLE